MSIHRNKTKKSQDIRTWIRQRISPYDYGVKTSVKPVHCNKNDSIKIHFQALRAGHWSRWLTRLKNADMADHFAGRKTYYFTADGRCSVPEVLVNIDIDCHHSGSLDGALAFARHLRATRFPGLYFETSTNGQGVHGYVVVEKGDLGDEGLNSALKRLDRWLKHQLSQTLWDVEDVEVKGHAPELTWDEAKYELKTYKAGQLAKLPREALARADELARTTRIAVDDLRRLRLPSDAIEAQELVVRNPLPRKPQIVSDKIKQKTGSIVGRHFGHEELGKLQGSYLSLSTDLLGEENLVAAGRKVVTGEDLAIFLMVLKFFTKNMNVDRTLPTARWREMWDALHEAGDVDRAWCHHRFAAMRNFLSGKDLLSWEDEGYMIGSEVQGRYVPGKAAKWRANEELMARLEKADQLSEEAERGKSILYGCNASSQPSGTSETNEFFLDLALAGQKTLGEEGRSTLYGCRTPFRNPFPETTGQSHHAELPFLARLRVEIPIQKPQFMGCSWSQRVMMMAA